MKKLIISLLCAITSAFTVPAVLADNSNDLIFTPDTNGKYIYCNNHEFIRRSDLADFSNEHSRFIMNNENLTADKYAMFISHVNHTEVRKADNSIAEAGFDIEVDAVFMAEKDTVIRLSAVGFEVPENKQYWYKGKSYTYEDEWGCFNTWASYLQLPIRQIDSGQMYEPVSFEPVEFEIKAGQMRWLSEFIPNYSVDPWFRPVHIMADFEILSGECDVNVAALKSTGTVGDRSFFDPNSGFGSYERDRQYKGIADSLNRVSASLSYTIDDDLWSGTALPVTVYNQAVPEGNVTTKWYTHLNPRADQWSNKLCTESDMLAFSYYDPMKKIYYGSNTAEKDDYWHFDTYHSDTSQYQKSYGDMFTYVPNDVLPGSEVYGTSCNLGNYGVILNYDIDITNSGNLIRYVTYRLSTGSNNVVILRDGSGNLVDPYALCKGTRDARVSDNMACVELPAHQTTSFSVQVILTTNYAGGMENSLLITDTPNVVEVYDSQRQEISKVYNHTGKEFYKWENKELYISDDLKSWRRIKLDERIKSAVNGNWNEFKLLYTGDGYMLKPCIYDGIPYYTVQNFFKTVYFLNENFGYVSEHKFDYYPSDFAAANGSCYIKAATPYVSSDNQTWEYWQSPLPCFNYGRFSAITTSDSILLSENGSDFTKAVYGGFNPSYIDSVADVYYYAENSILYTSYDGIYWSKYDAGEKIKSLYKIGGELIINGSQSVSLPEKQDYTVIMSNGEYAGFADMPLLQNGVTLIPARAAAEYFGMDINYDRGILTLSDSSTNMVFMTGSDTSFVNGKRCGIGSDVTVVNDRAYVDPLFIAKQLGMSVEIDSKLNTAVIKSN